ncbi:hypothetical protein NFI96_026476 [Prochilodus magdalenae]|nr:hypothetical protein NFI96_026476 [Prochilodus magdalenae]
MRWFLLFSEWLVDWARGTFWYLCGKRTGLCKGILSPPGPMIFDQKRRGKVLKQEFDKYDVPQKLDAIVIGSGVGGLTTAAVLAKLGKKVLVLEQNDQAGGLCQTFTKDGFEFDSAFHYVGQVHENSLLKITFDQITDGQLCFAELDPHVDTVVIGTGKGRKQYTIYSGKRQMEAHLKKQFPNDTKAIEEFFKIMKTCSRKIHLLCDLKLVPLWFARFILWSGIADWISPIFKYSRTSTSQMISSLTGNKDLLTVLSHICYGVPPKDSSGMISALFLHHSKRGSFYPKGGASEIPYHIIPVIVENGGKVLVKAPVSRILVDKSGSAYGVTVKTMDEEVEIRAPVVISNAGSISTFQKLLPPEIKSKPEVMDCLENMKPGRGFFQVFAGFNATQEELGIPSTSYRLYKSNDMDTALEEYFSMDEEDAPDNIPMMYMSFPSAKDPTSKIRFPGQSRMMIHTVVNSKWFGKWKGIAEEDRGEDFSRFKMRFANHLFDWACVHFPKLREKLVMLHAVSPINMHGLGAPQGAMLSAEHNLERFHPLTIAKMRSTTPIKNLYLSGQDVFSAGVSGAVHGGLLSNMRWCLLFSEWFVDWARGTFWYLCGKRTGLCKGILSPPGTMLFDQKRRKRVLRQEFDKYDVPQKLDAIVIGSGVGGLTAAAVLAKLGKKVLVLEQNDQAGGLCQTFTKDGFEFDSAFHYVGQVHENSFLKIAFDQITDGQLCFAELDPHVDTVVIGTGKQYKQYTIYSGKRQMEAHLKKQFPNDTKAIEEFFKIMKTCSRKIHLLCDLKLVPLWFARFILWSGIADWISPIFKYSRTSTSQMISSLTDNKDLLTVLSHICYGVPPKDSSSMITAMFLHHSKRGSFYPKGGASEIPYHIIPVIEKNGGKVLVKAPVSRILVDKKGRAYGVTVKTVDEEVEIRAPVVISNAGSVSTFHELLPPEIKSKPEVMDCLENMKPGRGFFQVFAGFNATQEELGIPSTSYRLYKSNDMDTALEEYFSMDEEDAPDNIPMMYMSFPSAKDPTSKIRFPGQSRMMIHTVVNSKWFGKWKGIAEEDRGEDFNRFKMRFANHLFDWACVHFPKLREKLVMLHAVSPINMHGLGAPRGAMLSAEHNLERFHPLTIAKTRSTTPIKNLYLSGQDVFSSGVSGAVHGGLLCASSVLGHVVYVDLLLQQRKLKRNVAKKIE